MDNTDQDTALARTLQKGKEASAAGDLQGVAFIFKSLAANGNTAVLAHLGTLYAGGGGNLKRDFEEANKWYRRALFERDDPLAHLGIGIAYENGDGGIEQDVNKAYEHYMKAHRAGLPAAALMIGNLYYRGAIGKNLEKAKEFYQQAAKNEFILAYFRLAHIAIRSGHIFEGLKLHLAARPIYIRIKTNDPYDIKMMGLRSWQKRIAPRS